MLRHDRTRLEARVECVATVHLEVSASRALSARSFYTRALGLDERSFDRDELVVGDIKWPIRVAIRPEPSVDATRRRCMISVNSLSECERRLGAFGCEIHRVQGLCRTDVRIHVQDPDGNLICVTQTTRF